MDEAGVLGGDVTELKLLVCMCGEGVETGAVTAGERVGVPGV